MHHTTYTRQNTSCITHYTPGTTHHASENTNQAEHIMYHTKHVRHNTSCITQHTHVRKHHALCNTHQGEHIMHHSTPHIRITDHTFLASHVLGYISLFPHHSFLITQNDAKPHTNQGIWAFFLRYKFLWIKLWSKVEIGWASIWCHLHHLNDIPARMRVKYPTFHRNELK